MPNEVNGYDGPGFTGSPMRIVPPDGVKRTHRELMEQFVRIGRHGLNLADFQRTMHLQPGKGRLACDPETGEFDKDAPRTPYVVGSQPAYPRYIHSRINETESKLVKNEEEHHNLLATGKWSDFPIEKRRRYTLTQEDALLDMKDQLNGMRARNIELERRWEGAALGGNSPDNQEAVSELTIRMQHLEEQNRLQQERIELLLGKLESREEVVSSGKGKK